VSRYDWPRPPKNDNPAARADHNARLRPPADVSSLGVVPKELKKNTRRKRAVSHNAPSGNANLWFPIGPSAMTNGQATTGPNVAGRVRDVQVEPINGLRLYAASASGGVWFSADTGLTWSPLDDFQQTPDRSAIGLVANSLACGALHVIWGGQANGSADEVWVGTGELGGGASGTPGGQIGGIGFLHRTGAGWAVVKGDPPATDPDTLRGETVYRIVADPGNVNQLVAATSKGIYVLPPGGSWTRASHWPSSGNVSDHAPVDVVLTRNGTKLRVWVVEYGHLWVAEVPAANPIDPAALSFTQVTVNNVAFRRMALAAAGDNNTVYLLGLRPKTPAEVTAANNDRTPVAHLWTVNANAATLASIATTERPGLPTALFMSSSDQSFYDMCIAAHPTVAGRILVGGAAVYTTNWNAALYSCDTTVNPVVPTLIGDRVHSDVHIIRIRPQPAGTGAVRDVWVGCDGGLFYSSADGAANSFVPRNDGLAVLEPGYVANHPTNPGIVVAGFQDNGTAIRTGDTVWRESFQGDGGGVIWDPDLSAPMSNRYLRQYNAVVWQSSDHGAIPVVQRQNPLNLQTITDSEKYESSRTQFYSGGDAASLGPADNHLVIGTNRVWYTRDFGRTWTTLPTGSDPRATNNPNDTQDVVTPQLTADGSTCSDAPPSLPPGIIAVKLASPAPTATEARLRAVSLYPGGLVWMTGSRPLASTGAFSWTQASTDHPLPTQAFRAPKSGTETDSYNSGADLHFLPAPGVVSDLAIHDASLGSLGSCYVSTIGARDFGPGTPGARLDTLWFFDGTDRWIPCGLRTDNPNGRWTGTRITAPALGVVVDAVGPDRNTVYVATSVGVVKGTMRVIGGPSYSWDWELFANGLPEAAVQDLSIRTYGNVRLLRAALQARGVWETDLGNTTSTDLTYLRSYASDTRRLLPTALTGPTVEGNPATPRWDKSPDVVIDATGTTPADPNEAVLANVPAAGPAGTRASVVLTNRTPSVHVLLHHRASDPLPPASVKVALLRHAFPATGTIPIGPLWAALVAAAPGTAVPAALPDGWSAASADFWRSPAGPIETRMPRSVTFALNFVPASNPAGTQIVLLAVVMTATNQISDADLTLTSTTKATTLDQLVTTSPHVGVASIELA